MRALGRLHPPVARRQRRLEVAPLEQHPGQAAVHQHLQLRRRGGVVVRHQLECPLRDECGVEGGVQVRSEARRDRLQDRQRGRPGRLLLPEQRPGTAELPRATADVELGQRHGGADQRRVGPARIVRQTGEHVPQHRALVTDEQVAHPAPVDEVRRGLRPGLRRDGVPDRRHPLPVRHQPLGGRAVELGHERGSLERQPAAQELAEERAVAITAPDPRDGLDERVAVCHELECPRIALQAGEGTDQPRVELVGDAGPEQELPGVRRLGGEHLVHEVRGDVPRVPTELPDGLGGVDAAGQAHRGELQARGPAAGAFLQRGQVDRVQGESGAPHQP